MEVGILLEIDNSILDNIRYDISLGGNPQKFLLKVLTIWKENPKRPYTWNTILNVLASSSVGFISLADEIKTKLLSGGKYKFDKTITQIPDHDHHETLLSSRSEQSNNGNFLDAEREPQDS
jgi:hypothetical protein